MKKTLFLTMGLFWLTALVFWHGSRDALAENIDPDDDSSQYTYGENVGWFNYDPNQGEGVCVKDTLVSGYVWAENIGWINLRPTTYGGVVNDGNGNLSGYAWGENVGWIIFSCDTLDYCGTVPFGVWIDEDGEFNGYAWGENIGWIHFQSSSPYAYKVQTFWETGMADADCDCALDSSDNCPETPNPDQLDSYPPGGNSCGDACECEGDVHGPQEGDTDGDVDGSDAFVFKSHFGRNSGNHPCTIGDRCYRDFECDGDVDGTDAFKFKVDFGRSNCPVCVFECVAPSRFTDNEDGTVTDNDSGLMWTKDAFVAGCCYTWQESFDYTAQMNAGTHENFGYSNWRVPSRLELESLLDLSQSEPCLPIGHPFENSSSWFLYECWSSNEVDPNIAWVVSFYDCSTPQRSKTSSYFLWPVRTP